MTHLGFMSYKDDPGIWIREAINDDGSDYWEYGILYVDDALCISTNSEDVLKNEIGKYFLIKSGSVGYPNIYLGNKVLKVTLDNGFEAWSFSSSQYVQNYVSNFEKYLKKFDMKLPMKAPAPFTSGYCTELDITPELDSKEAACYHSLI